MRTLTTSDMDALAAQLERTARILRSKGHEALRRAKDWATPLHSATPGGRGKGHVSDPTGTTATSDFPDPNREELILLTSEAGRAFDAVTTIESRVMRIATDAVIENQRAGIGFCSCGRYCDGTPSNRLRNDACPACDQKYRRQAKTCQHAKALTSKGVIHCMDCGIELADIGVPVAASRTG